jgi:hypothetical protein
VTDSVLLFNLTTSGQREYAILNGVPGTIVFDSNPQNSSATSNAFPWYSVNSYGVNAVNNNQTIIAYEASKYNIDPNLLSAIIYLENSHGYYDLGIFGHTVGPANIDADRWGSLFPGAFWDDVADSPSINIEIAAKILNSIQSRLVKPTPEAIATLYNSLSKDKITGYGLAVAQYMKAEPWKRCFPATTLIQTSNTTHSLISLLRIGDTVLAFDPTADLGRGSLVPRRVTRLFRNSTTEWIMLTWVDPVSGEAKELVATPGHNMLDKFGGFSRLDALVKGNICEIILSSGDCIMAQAERLVYTSATADMFEQATAMAATSGALAIAPHTLDAWATYNFEVEDLHTYVAGGVRVHNDSLFRPVTDLGRLGDNVASQISDFAFGHNTLGSVFAGSALRSVVSTLGDVFDPKAAASCYPAANFEPYHLAGRYIADVAGGLGAIGGSLLAQDLVSGLGIRGPAGHVANSNINPISNMLISTSVYNLYLQKVGNLNNKLMQHLSGAHCHIQKLAA